MLRKFYLLLFISFFIFIAVAQSQSFYNWKRDRKAIFSIGTGLSSYQGDLESDRLDIDAKPNILISFMYPIRDRIDVGLDFMWYRIQSADGDDKIVDSNDNLMKRNLSFRSDNFELSAIVNVSLFTQRNTLYYNRPKYNPYILAGIGITSYNPKAELNGEWIKLRPLQTEGEEYGKFALVIPVGIGINYKISNTLNIGLEAAYRFTSTDYLDDVSTVHLDPSIISDPVRLALADRRPEIGFERVPGGTKRGNPDNNDGYFITNIKLSYFLPMETWFKKRGMRKPKFQGPKIFR